MNRFARSKTAAGICGGMLFAALLMAAPAFAQEEATQPENTTAGWIFRWLNFAVVFFAILYVLVKKARPAFRAHREAIQTAIAEGTRAREEADQRRREAEQKLAGIQQEIEGMRAQSKKDAEAETERIRKLAREEAIKMDHAAEVEIAAAERAARFDLKATAARLAIERAEAQLRQQLTPPADSQLVRNFVGDLEGSQN
jgi:F-type H+-transporting ATPase subunit b